LKRLLHKGIEDQLEKDFMENLVRRGWGTDQEFHDFRKMGANLRPARRALRAKALSSKERRAVGKAFSGGIVTADRLIKFGYQLSPICPLCGMEDDSVFHRAWECAARPHIQCKEADGPLDEPGDDRERTLAEVRSRAMAGGRKSWLYGRGVASHVIHPHAGLGGGVTKITEPWTPFDPRDGPIYPDGSCIGPSGGHPRAGFAAVQVDGGGKLLRGVWGSIPFGWNQEANTAEHYAIAKAEELAKAGCKVLTDCATVVKGWAKGLGWAAGPRRPHGGIWRELARGIHSGTGFAEVGKTKAHRNLESLEGEELQHGMGNDVADTYARIGAGLHDISRADRKLAEKHDEESLEAVLELGRALAAWPPSCELFGHLDKAERSLDKKGRSSQAHVMGWAGGAWCCRLCDARPRGGKRCLSTSCPGCPARLVGAIKNPQGHRLMQAWEGDREEGRSVVWCRVCGCHAHRVPKLLCKPCRGKESARGRTTLARLRQGLHPTCDSLMGQHEDLSGCAL